MPMPEEVLQQLPGDSDEKIATLLFRKLTLFNLGLHKSSEKGVKEYYE